MTDFDPNVTQRVKAAVKRRVVKDWRQRLGDYSTIALGSITGITALWVGLPADIKAAYPKEITDYIAYAVGALGVWGTIGKFISQTRPAEPADQEKQP